VKCLLTAIRCYFVVLSDWLVRYVSCSNLPRSTPRERVDSARMHTKLATFDQVPDMNVSKGVSTVRGCSLTSAGAPGVTAASWLESIDQRLCSANDLPVDSTATRTARSLRLISVSEAGASFMLTSHACQCVSVVLFGRVVISPIHCESKITPLDVHSWLRHILSL